MIRRRRSRPPSSDSLEALFPKYDRHEVANLEISGMGPVTMAVMWTCTCGAAPDRRVLWHDDEEGAMAAARALWDMHLDAIAGEIHWRAPNPVEQINAGLAYIAENERTWNPGGVIPPWISP